MRQRCLAAVLAGCAVAGGACGAAAAALLASGAPAPSTLPVLARVPASVLQRPQRRTDLDGVPATPGLRRSTLRRMGRLDPDDLVLIGRDVAGDRCIVAVAPAERLFRAGCVPEAAFPSAGARVAWSVAGGARQLAAAWGPDGTVRGGDARPGQ